MLTNSVKIQITVTVCTHITNINKSFSNFKFKTKLSILVRNLEKTFDLVLDHKGKVGVIEVTFNGIESISNLRLGLNPILNNTTASSSLITTEAAISPSPSFNISTSSSASSLRQTNNNQASTASLADSQINVSNTATTSSTENALSNTNRDQANLNSSLANAISLTGSASSVQQDLLTQELPEG